MKTVILDNWTLESAANNIIDTYEGTAVPNNEYVTLIEALILWENVSFFEYEMSQFWKNKFDRIDYNFNQYIKPISAPALHDSYYSSPQNSSIVEQGALDYYNKCSSLGVDYLVVHQRADFLSKYFKDMPQVFNRASIMDYTDTKLEKIRQEINSKLGSPYFKFYFPALFDYVRKTTDNPTFYLKTALQLRDSCIVKRFHKWLNSFEEAVNSRNLKDTTLLLNDIDRLFVNEFDVSTGSNVELIFSVPPSISSSINFSLPSYRDWNLTFLKRVISPPSKSHHLN